MPLQQPQGPQPQMFSRPIVPDAGPRQLHSWPACLRDSEPANRGRRAKRGHLRQTEPTPGTKAYRSEAWASRLGGRVGVGWGELTPSLPAWPPKFIHSLTFTEARYRSCSQEAGAWKFFLMSDRAPAL